MKKAAKNFCFLAPVSAGVAAGGVFWGVSMDERALDCFADEGGLPIQGAVPGEDCGGYPAACGFTGAAGQVVLLPGPSGLAGALVGLGETPGPHVFGGLPGALPPGDWHLGHGIPDLADAVLGWAMGAYRYDLLKQRARPQPRLVLPAGMDATLSAARATWLARDLINTPANLLGPAELARIAADSLRARGAHVKVIEGETVALGFPALYAVAEGSQRGPCVLHATWCPPGAPDDAPLVSLCGKGVCFDTGGYDIKPSAGMLRMKKDMGGAAVALGLACMIVDAGVKVRLELRLGCVENMISGASMRPGDVLRTPRRPGCGSGQHGRRRQAGAVRPAQRGVRVTARPSARFRNVDRRRPRGARPRPAGAVHER